MARKPRGKSFPFDTRAFLSDSAVRRMSLAARGAYITLLCECWESEEPGMLEGSDEVVRRLAGCDPEEWRTIREELVPAFDLETKPGTWIQKRMRQTFKAQNEYYRRMSQAGARGATARWSRNHQQPQQDEWPPHSQANGPPMAEQWRPGPSTGTENPTGPFRDLYPGTSLSDSTSHARGLNSAATQPRDPNTEAQALRLDTRLVSAGIGPELRRLVLDHYRANAGTIASPDAYYRPGTDAWLKLVMDLSRNYEIRMHRGGSDA